MNKVKLLLFPWHYWHSRIVEKINKYQNINHCIRFDRHCSSLMCQTTAFRSQLSVMQSRLKSLMYIKRKMSQITHDREETDEREMSKQHTYTHLCHQSSCTARPAQVYFAILWWNVLSPLLVTLFLFNNKLTRVCDQTLRSVYTIKRSHFTSGRFNYCDLCVWCVFLKGKKAIGHALCILFSFAVCQRILILSCSTGLMLCQVFPVTLMFDSRTCFCDLNMMFKGSLAQHWTIREKCTCPQWP